MKGRGHKFDPRFIEDILDVGSKIGINARQLFGLVRVSVDFVGDPGAVQGRLEHPGAGLGQKPFRFLGAPF
jgi:hypothetical protein